MAILFVMAFEPVTHFIVPQSLDAQIFSTRYSITWQVYTGYHDRSEIEHGLYAFTVDSPLAKACELSLGTSAQIMLYLSCVFKLQICHQNIGIAPGILAAAGVIKLWIYCDFWTEHSCMML